MFRRQDRATVRIPLIITSTVSCVVIIQIMLGLLIYHAIPTKETAMGSLKEAVNDADYFFSEMEVLKNYSGVSKTSIEITVVIPAEKAEKMVGANALVTCDITPIECLEPEWKYDYVFGYWSNDESATQHRSPFQCVRAGIKNEYIESLCVDKTSGKVVYYRLPD